MFSVIKLVYTLINLCLAWSFLRALYAAGVGRFWRWLGFVLVLAFSLAFPLSRLLEGNSLWVRGLNFAGTIWLAFVLHLLLLTLFWGMSRGLWRLWRRHPLPQRSPRQRLRGQWLRILGAFVLTAASWVNTQFPVARNIALPAPAGLTRPLRVAALSDTHLGRLVSPRDFDRLVDLIAPFSPDLVLFAGDVIDDHAGLDVAALRQSLARLSPRLGIWGALGNHEYYASEGKAEKSLALLEAGGIRILRDAWTNLDDEVVLIGRDDRARERFSTSPRQTLPQILATLPADLRVKPRLLLDHQPFHLEEAEAAGIFLQLSGHTHNGQLFPFNYLVALMYENAHGHSRRGETHYWVSSGAGTWGPRGRTTGRPEVLLIQIQPEQQDGAEKASKAGVFFDAS